MKWGMNTGYEYRGKPACPDYTGYEITAHVRHNYRMAQNEARTLCQLNNISKTAKQQQRNVVAN